MPAAAFWRIFVRNINGKEIVVTIIEKLNSALDKADAVYKANDMTLGAKVNELESVLLAVIVAVKELDARLSA